jgi:cation diffusion facilitator family transporter
MAQGTMKAVVTAMIANAVLTVFKFAAALVTHSASMMNEAIHSLMDSLNQAFLYFGLRAARKPPDREYAFGHGQKKFLWNLWSAIGLFSIGCGLGLSHAWHSWSRLSHKQPPAPLEMFGIGIDPLWIAGVVLVIAFLLDGYSTVGVLLAAAGITLSALLDNPVWDIVFSAMIALLLGIAAFFLGRVNMRFLTDVRDTDAEEVFAQVVREHREVERYHDLRSIILDDEHTILVAEIELREEALVQLAAAVRKKLPRIHHVTIEIEGIATSPVASTIA